MKEQNILYADKTLEFVRTAAEYCRYLEGCTDTTKRDFARTLCALLPMVYLKAVMLPTVEELDGYVIPAVTEDDYNYVRRNVATVLGGDDDYLDVQMEDYKYSDQPILHTVSEDLADIYQQLRDLVETFREGHEEAMQVRLHEAHEEFFLTWGGKLLAALRTLHNIYTDGDGGDE